jgi:hypothetical protein
MNNIVFVLIGLFFIGFGIFSIATGEIVGIGSINTANRVISFQESPIEYLIALVLDLSIGLVLVKKAVSDIVNKRPEK